MIFAGAIGYGGSYFEFLFRLFKTLRLQGILQNGAGAVRVLNDRGPGYCLDEDEDHVCLKT